MHSPESQESVLSRPWKFPTPKAINSPLGALGDPTFLDEDVLTKWMDLSVF